MLPLINEALFSIPQYIQEFEKSLKEEVLQRSSLKHMIVKSYFSM